MSALHVGRVARWVTRRVRARSAVVTTHALRAAGGVAATPADRTRDRSGHTSAFQTRGRSVPVLSAVSASQFPAAQNAASRSARTAAMPPVSATARGNERRSMEPSQGAYDAPTIGVSISTGRGRDSPRVSSCVSSPQRGLMRCRPGVRDRGNLCGNAWHLQPARSHATWSAGTEDNVASSTGSPRSSQAG